MIRFVRKYFHPGTSVYVYSLPKEDVVAHVAKVLNRDSGLFDENDTGGDFIDNDSFKLFFNRSTLSFAGIAGVKGVGVIEELPNGHSQVTFKTYLSIALYIWIGIAVILGFLYLYRYFQMAQIASLFKAFGSLIIGPAFCIGVSNVAQTAIKERYIIFFHKELKKMSEDAKG